MATEGTFPKVDGDVLYASEINSFARPIQEIYTGTDFNSSSGENAIDEQSHELNTISSISLQSSKYIKIKITGFGEVRGYANNTGKTELKTQIKDIGGTYIDIVPYVIFALSKHMDSSSVFVSVSNTYELIYELTENMKTNGVQLKCFSLSTGTGDNSQGAFTNIQTVVELL